LSKVAVRLLLISVRRDAGDSSYGHFLGVLLVGFVWANPGSCRGHRQIATVELPEKGCEAFLDPGAPIGLK
jgi:hypothetical protein